MKKSDIKKLAQLARIHINDDDTEAVTQRLTTILTMINRIQAVNTEAIEPMANPNDAKQRLRTDQVTESNQRDQLQSGAPEVKNGLFLVPDVMEATR